MLDGVEQHGELRGHLAAPAETQGVVCRGEFPHRVAWGRRQRGGEFGRSEPRRLLEAAPPQTPPACARRAGWRRPRRPRRGARAPRGGGSADGAPGAAPGTTGRRPRNPPSPHPATDARGNRRTVRAPAHPDGGQSVVPADARAARALLQAVGQGALPADVVAHHPVLPEGLARRPGRARISAGRLTDGRGVRRRGIEGGPAMAGDPGLHPDCGRRRRAPATARSGGCRCRSGIRWPCAPGCPGVRSMTAMAEAKYSQYPLRLVNRKSASGSAGSRVGSLPAYRCSGAQAAFQGAGPFQVGRGAVGHGARQLRDAAIEPAGNCRFRSRSASEQHRRRVDQHGLGRVFQQAVGGVWKRARGDARQLVARRPPCGTAARASRSSFSGMPAKNSAVSSRRLEAHIVVHVQTRASGFREIHVAILQPGSCCSARIAVVPALAIEFAEHPAAPFQVRHRLAAEDAHVHNRARTGLDFAHLAQRSPRPNSPAANMRCHGSRAKGGVGRARQNEEQRRGQDQDSHRDRGRKERQPRDGSASGRRAPWPETARWSGGFRRWSARRWRRAGISPGRRRNSTRWRECAAATSSRNATAAMVRSSRCVRAVRMRMMAMKKTRCTVAGRTAREIRKQSATKKTE